MQYANRLMQLKFTVNVLAGLAAIASALTSFEAFESRFLEMGEYRFAATMVILVGSAVSATGADVRASGAACLLFLLAFYHIPEMRNAFPFLHAEDLESVVDGVTSIPTKINQSGSGVKEAMEEAAEEGAEEGAETVEEGAEAVRDAMAAAAAGAAASTGAAASAAAVMETESDATEEGLMRFYH